MAVFKVSVERLGRVWDHPNADKMDLASVEGMSFQFCVSKGRYKTGDLVVYFPIDSILTDVLIERFGIRNFLAGAKKDRLKTARLRGQFSQGFVALVSDVFPGETLETGLDVTERLGVIKYEPPAVLEKGANLISLPCGLSMYDIEGIERFQFVVDYMMDKRVKILEKVEGQNLHFDYSSALQKFYVSQRRYTIEEIPGSEHTWWKYAREMKLDEIIKTLEARYKENVALYGEGIGPGIQGNMYKLATHKCLFFDLKVGERFVNCLEFFQTMAEFSLPTAPVLAYDVVLREWLGGKTITEMSDGKSQLYDTEREGIVISLMEEETIPDFGRSIIKKRGPLYLSKTDN